MLAWLVACGAPAEVPTPAAPTSSGPNGSRVFTAAELRALPTHTVRAEVDGACATFEGVTVGDVFAAAGLDEAAVARTGFGVETATGPVPGEAPAAFRPIPSPGCGEDARRALLAWSRDGRPLERLHYVVPGAPDLALDGAHALMLEVPLADPAAFAGVAQSGGVAVVGAAVP